MTQYVARVEDGRVVQVTIQPEDYRPATGEVVIGSENTVAIGWHWDGETFGPPVMADEAGGTA